MKRKSQKHQLVAEEQKPKAPSRYMQLLIKQNFVELIHKYDLHQKYMRIEAMTKTRKHLAKRFMKLYRLYRHKKFGEPFDEAQHTWSLEDSDEFGFNKVYIPKNL